MSPLERALSEVTPATMGQNMGDINIYKGGDSWMWDKHPLYSAQVGDRSVGKCVPIPRPSRF